VTALPAVRDLLRTKLLELTTVMGIHRTHPVIAVGIVPDVDIPKLKQAGVAAVLGPGASNDEVIAAVEAAASVSSRPDEG
jgi:methylmalonyl-CoA mutase cobalamin-binding domain/chain